LELAETEPLSTFKLMEFKIVFLATVAALFWDEVFLNVMSILINKRLSVKFMFTWSIVSGLLMSLLVACHVPDNYRKLTVVMVGLGVLFSIHGVMSRQREDDAEKKSLNV
jgi:hypothetical protein